MRRVWSRERYLYVGLWIVLAIVVAVVVFAVVRNSADDSAAAPVNSGTTTAGTSATPTNPYVAAALAAYAGYWSAYVTVAADLNASTVDLNKYVGDPLLTELMFTVKQTRANGIVYKGHPTSTPGRTTVNDTASPVSVSIDDCFDAAGWEPVFASTGKSAAAPGQVNRYMITSTVSLFEGRGWLVVESRADRSATC